MSDLPPDLETPEVPRGAKAKRASRVIRGLMWAGLLLLVLGFAVAFASPTPSALATALLSVGLLAEVASLVARRVEFWAGVYGKDRKTARKVRKPGT